MLQFRYETLDGMRGVAALGVLIFHLSILGVHVADHGYLAVDFFFILSGFVLSHAYADRHPRMNFSLFLRQRLVRIMPLSVLGLLLGSSYFLLRHFSQSSSLYSLEDIVMATVLNVALIPKPWMTSAPTDTIFPSNTPLWSLSLEMFVNIFWFGLLYRARISTLIILVAVSALFLSSFVLYYKTADLGATWPTYCGGIARVMFGFFMGALIWHYKPKPVKSKAYVFISAFALIVILMFPACGTLFDLFAILFAFPVIVLMASSSNFGPETYFLRLIGNISYPLYLIHVPVFHYAVGIAKAFDIKNSLSFAMTSIFSCIILAFILDLKYDRPLRKYLGTFILKK